MVEWGTKGTKVGQHDNNQMPRPQASARQGQVKRNAGKLAHYYSDDGNFDRLSLNLSLSLASLRSRNLDYTWTMQQLSQPNPRPCGRIAAVECPPTSSLSNSNPSRIVSLTYSWFYSSSLRPAPVFEVLTKVKLHCTNCQSLVRLLPGLLSSWVMRPRFAPGVLSLPLSLLVVSFSPNLAERASG